MILIDVSRLVARYQKGLLPTGVDRVCLAYIAHFQSQALAVLSEGAFNAVLSTSDSTKMFDALLNPTVTSKLLLKRLILKARMVGWMRAWWNYKNAILINVSHTGLEHREYAMPLRLRGVKPLLMVHDLIPITHPEFVCKGDDIQHKARIKNALKMASGIVTNSQHTLDALTQFAKQHGYTMPQVAVAPLAHGLDEPLDAHVIASKSPFSAPYFVMLGTIEPRKNHWLLLQLWQRLIDELGEKAPRLVIIGRRGWECDHVIDLLERCEKLKGYVIELSDCSDQQLANILRFANALLFPTLTEGFGLPITEALQLKVPVIASDLAVFKEFANEVPEYLDPLDSHAWHQSILEYMDIQHPKRQAQIARMQSLTLPTWQTHFEKVDALIKRLS